MNSTSTAECWSVSQTVKYFERCLESSKTEKELRKQLDGAGFQEATIAHEKDHRGNDRFSIVFAHPMGVEIQCHR